MKCLLLGPKAVESILKHKIIGCSVKLEKLNYFKTQVPHLSLSLSLPFFIFFYIKTKEQA